MTANVIGFTISGGERPGAPGSWAVDGHLGGAGGLGLGASGLQDPNKRILKPLSPNTPRSTFGKMFPVKVILT